MNKQSSIKSKLFTDAHKMTKLTIKHGETYRYKFGQWLIFLKTGITNVLRLTNINQSVCYVPMLKHDKEYQYSNNKSFMFNVLKFICTNPLSLFFMFLIALLTVL